MPSQPPARAALTPTIWEAAWAEGGALGLDEAVALGLDELTVSTGYRLLFWSFVRRGV